MKRLLPAILLSVAAACATTPPTAASITLPMAVPLPPVNDGPKHEPFVVGTVVPVPDAAGRVRVANMPRVDGRARLAVDWPGAPGYRLQLRAEGGWPLGARVRVLDADGEPLHADSWMPARNSRWWSAVGDGCCMMIEVEGPVGASAELVIIDATTVGGHQ